MPRIYCLPNMHKKDTPLRHIVSVINSLTYELASFISSTLQPLVGKTSSFIKDFVDFVLFIQNLHLEPTDLLVSFDVVSLFTKIPIKEALEVIGKSVNPDITNLIKICLESTFFNYQGQFYEQTKGMVMGSPLSPIIANKFMEHFESRALETTPLRPRYLKRFVDDTFVI